MSMYDVTSVLWRRKVLTALLFAGVAWLGVIAVFATQEPRHYTASTQILLDQPDLLGAPSGSGVPTKLSALALTFCQVLDSDVVVSRISKAANESAAAVTGLTRCTPLRDTTVLIVSARSRSAARSQLLADKASTELASTLARRYSGPSVEPGHRVQATVLAAPGKPGPDSRGTTRSLVLAVIAAGAFAAALVIGIEPHRRRDETAKADELTLSAP